MSFFACLETLYVLSSSKCHSVFMQQNKSTPTNNHASYSVYRIRGGLAANAVVCTFDAIIGTLSTVVNGNNGVKSAEARGLLVQVSPFRFVLFV